MNAKYILIVLCCFCLKAIAQTTLPDKNQVYMPKVLFDKVLYESKLKNLNSSNHWGQKDLPSEGKKAWAVFSDRANNTTYDAPNGTAYSKLNFNEEVIIAKIEKDYALVYTDPRRIYPSISSEAVCKGWIPMKNLLLWRTTPADDKGIYYKALLVVNLDQAQKGSDTYNKYYYEPTTNSAGRINQPGMEYFFIMKEQNGMVLLSSQHSMDGTSSQTLYGWVAKNGYIPWNQRTCLEPNWDPEEVERISGKTATVKADNGLETNYTFGKKWSDDSEDEDRYRMPSGIFRYPILDNDKNNGQFRCTTFGNPTGADNLVNVIKEWQEALVREETVLNNMKTLNLIVVIDGTNSMKPYFKAAKDAIIKGCEYFQENYNPRVGIVIYRDYKEGKYLSEYLPMTDAKSNSWKTFLDSGGKFGVRDSANKTMEEAVFWGINEALDNSKMGYTSDQSNLMLIVGDCGNRIPDPAEKVKSPTEEELLSKMQKNRVHLMSFQVRRNNAKPWLSFNRQMIRLLRMNVQNQYEKAKILTKVEFKELTNGYDQNTTLNESQKFYVGSIRYAMSGQEMPPSELTNLMSKNFGTFNVAIKNQIDVVYNLRNGKPGGRQTGADEEVNKSLLIELLGEQAYQNIVNMNKMLAYTGYTDKQEKTTGIDYWKPILFISREEFESLIGRFAEVDAKAKTGDCKPYVEAIKALVKSMLPGITDAEMDQKGLDEVMRLISGINVEVAFSTSPYKLEDMCNRNVVSASEFNSIITQFQQKYRNLRDILRDKNYRYATSINGIKYYWIPVEELP